MWNIWTGFLPFGVGMTITFLLLAVMLIVYALGCVVLWKEEREAEAEKSANARKHEKRNWGEERRRGDGRYRHHPRRVIE